MVTRIWIFAALLGSAGLALHGATALAAVVPPVEAAQAVVINDLAVGPDAVSGTVVNKTSATVGEVKVLLRQMWQWKDERHPGTDSPGRTTPFTLAVNVAPNASAPFTFSPPRLPQRSDGRFVTTMDVVGFSEVAR
jgi:hypothetical protein